jgi:hypothetical protein
VSDTKADAGVEWELNERWGVGRDPYNWKLYRKGKTKWQIVGYYGDPHQMLRGFLDHLLLNEDRGAEDIAAHLEVCLAKFDVGVRKLFAELGIAVAGEMKR